LPEILNPQHAARDSATLDQLRYEITSALHFSNAGGVYRAVDRRTGASSRARDLERSSPTGRG
jgi:hypothetical protein